MLIPFRDLSRRPSNLRFDLVIPGSSIRAVRRSLVICSVNQNANHFHTCTVMLFA